ncbi:MAG TPA: hypothetical protein PLS56_00955 [Candidatus Dojkabacteria bacterium]|nr:hypothetical protein [Candidatus Dojkabacteria bacterium]
MLKNLFISKVRISILTVFLSNINTPYHVRGLVRMLDEEINAVRRELINLENAGILKSKKEGNKLVYRVNKECPIIWELRSIFYKESDLGKAIISKVKTIEGVDIAVLTDSFIKSKYENDTDVDFLFIGSMKIRELSSVMSQIEKEFNREIRYSAITKEDFDFARKKKEPFLMNILQNDKIILIGQLSDLL